MIHLVTLNPALDFSFNLEKPKNGKIGKVSDFSVSPGGKAINIARFLKAAKVPAMVWLGTGAGYHPTHTLYRSLLAQEKLKVNFLSAEVPIRFNLVLKEKSKSTKFNHLGFETHFSAFSRLLKSVKKDDVVVLTGRLPDGENELLYAAWIEIFERKGVKTIVDTSGNALALALQAKPWFFKVNRHEMSEGILRKVANLKQVIQLVKKNWFKKNFEHGAVTDGDKGALLWCYPECYFLQTRKIPSALVVGAGDGFLAGYLYGLYSRKSLKETARLAAAFGTTVASEGIAGFTLEKMKKRLRQVRVRRIL